MSIGRSEPWSGSGKGVNVARFCGRMGIGVRLVAIADETGAASLATEPICPGHAPGGALWGVGPHGCHRGRGHGRASVLMGMAPGPSHQVLDTAVALLLDGLTSGDVLVLSGSLPPSAPVDLYARLIDATGAGSSFRDRRIRGMAAGRAAGGCGRGQGLPRGAGGCPRRDIGPGVATWPRRRSGVGGAHRDGRQPWRSIVDRRGLLDRQRRPSDARQPHRGG